jgi:hypothetical protein
MHTNFEYSKQYVSPSRFFGVLNVYLLLLKIELLSSSLLYLSSQECKFSFFWFKKNSCAFLALG